MPKCDFSRLALADLDAIVRYTWRTWGANQSRRYLDELKECIRNIAESPAIGRPCDGIKPGYRRMEHGRHVILYCERSGGIFISRVLHQRMLPRIHALE